MLQFSNVGCRFGFYTLLKDMAMVDHLETAGMRWVSSVLVAAVSGSIAGVVSNVGRFPHGVLSACPSAERIHRVLSRVQYAAGAYRPKDSEDPYTYTYTYISF